MGRVTSIQVNHLGEVTGAVVKKGATGEHVKRHSSVIIPLLRMCECNEIISEQHNLSCNDAPSSTGGGAGRPARAAAIASRQRTKAMM